MGSIIAARSASWQGFQVTDPMSVARNKKLILVLLIATVALGFFLRTYWNADAAQLEDGTYVLSGNDPYYHKHAVGHIVETGETLRHDPMLNYPIGSVNPNPPLFQWSMAVGAKLLSPFAEDQETATWWSVLYAPAIWGALTIIPVFLIARVFGGPWAGLLAAFFVATSPEHMSRTNLGFSDHDAMVIFLAVTGFYFLLESLRHLGDRPEETSIARIGPAFSQWFKGHRRSAGSAVLAGAFWGALALVWKGFPYVFGVVLGYLLLQFLINHWRNRDVARPFFAGATALAVTTLVGLPYYAGFGLMHFWNPALFLLLAVLALGAYFLATQEYPSILVIPGLAVLLGVFALVMFVVVPDISQALLNRFIYFRQTSLYTTIAEAHPADFSSLAFSVGPIPFFIYTVGFPWLIYRFWVQKRMADLFLLSWAAVDLYMAISAVRFLSQSVPSMAILSGIMTVWIIRMLNLPNVFERYRLAGGGWRGVRRSTNVVQIVTVIFVSVLLIAPNALLGVDAAVPSNLENRLSREAQQEAIQDIGEVGRELGLPTETIREFQAIFNGSRDQGEFQTNLRDAQLRLGLDDDVIDAVYDAGKDELETIGRYSKRLGAFGQNFLPTGWRQTLDHLRGLDNDSPPAERPAFIAWWDYGHWAIAVGRHPAVADNFQNGYRLAGTFLTAQNESHAVQLLGVRHARIMDEATYVETLVDQGIPRANASALYEDHTSLRYTYIPFADNEAESLVASQAWLASIEAETGKHIRYFAVDNRMMPLDDPRTPRIESPSIYYAPVTLAGKEPQDFVEDQLVDMDTGQVVTEAQLRALQRNPNAAAPNLGQTLVYKDQFFNSMYYRAFMGLPVNQPFSQGGEETPIPFNREAFQEHYRDGRMLLSPNPVSGAALTREIAPGFGLKHFRLIDGNEAVRMLEYYPGAVIEGRVTIAGEPVEGARVTVFDDAGELVASSDPDYFGNRAPEDLDVPHDSVLTDADGRYSLVAPFSTGRGVTVRATQEVARQAPAVLAQETLEITRAEAASGERFTLELAIEPATWDGIAFLDLDSDGALSDADRRLENVTVTIQGVTASTDEDGRFRFSNLVAGTYTVEAEAPGLRLRPGEARVNLPGGETSNETLAFEYLPLAVAGLVEDTSGASAEGVEVRFNPVGEDTPARAASAFSQVNGTVTVSLQPGTYHLNGTGRDARTNETLVVSQVEVVSGDGASVDEDGNLVLEPSADDVELRIVVERRAPEAAPDEPTDESVSQDGATPPDAEAGNETP